MNILAVLPLAVLSVVEGPDPEDVKAGWLGFGVFLLLVAAVVFLAFSLRKHLKKVDFDEGETPGEPHELTNGTNGSAGKPDTGS